LNGNSEVDKSINEPQTYEMQLDNLESNEGDKLWAMIVIDDNGNQSNSLNVTQEEKEREIELKKFYENKYNQLEEKFHEVDIKATELIIEADNFQKKNKRINRGERSIPKEFGYF